ncbi:Amidohydrolase [Thiothrix caldifontis]|uniref:Amidohydrolase n=1 Tax=Thiothrix caldifontis TaxID=525918 RepID=A0A1H3ZCT7_9GAMM|nr:amidohydrolase family protein [Thiothrix caldifontis]SEA21609.1 Amidohydrolase [Thiothrix caldifontis]
MSSSNLIEPVIYNCHTHIFTHKHIPDGYFPLFIVKLARNKVIRGVLNTVMQKIVPWTSNDRFQRCANFVSFAYKKGQEDNLKVLMNYYPKGTRFVVLPMDMAYMAAGKVMEDIDKQHQELVCLANREEYKNIIIPFAHIDPRRPAALERLAVLVEEQQFRGVKIYPPLGYYPCDPVLMHDIYPYMVKHKLPLIAHCSPGSVNTKHLPFEEAQGLADPKHYAAVMKKFPDLKICLSHFGGISEWQRYLTRDRSIDNPTWLEKILDMMRSGNYPNLYADVSYTVFNFQENITLLKVLLEDERVRTQVLFGSDFYMTSNERYPERRLSIDLRAALGETLFWQIANQNPKKFLAEAA